jgi:hypothetical protein
MKRKRQAGYFFVAHLVYMSTNPVTSNFRTGNYTVRGGRALVMYSSQQKFP